MNEEILTINDNVYLNGTNNAGKTTILKGLGYLQGISAPLLDKDGKSFISYYFPPGNSSYIIQQVRKVDGMVFCLILYQGGGIFAIGDYSTLRPFIISDEGIVSTKGNLLYQLKKANITVYDAAVKEWRMIFYGNREKVQGGDPFVYSDCGTDIIPRLGNTLLSKEITGGDICRLLDRTGMSRDLVFSLKDFRKETEEYNDKISDYILNWGTKEKPGSVLLAMQNISLDYDNMKSVREDLVNTEREISFQYAASSQKLKDLDAELRSVKETVDRLSKKKHTQQDALGKEETKLEVHIKAWNTFKTAFIKNQTLFGTPDMQEMISKYNRLQDINDNINRLTENIATLKAKSGLSKDEAYNGLRSDMERISTVLSKTETAKEKKRNEQIRLIQEQRNREDKAYWSKQQEFNTRLKEVEQTISSINLVLNLTNRLDYKNLDGLLDDSQRHFISEMSGFAEQKKSLKETQDTVIRDIASLNDRIKQLDSYISQYRKDVEEKSSVLKNKIKEEVSAMFESFPEIVKSAAEKILVRVLAVVDRFFEKDKKDSYEKAQSEAKKVNKEKKAKENERRTIETAIFKVDNSYDRCLKSLDGILNSKLQADDELKKTLNDELSTLEKNHRQEYYWAEQENNVNAAIEQEFQPVIDDLKDKLAKTENAIRDFEAEFERLVRLSLGDLKSRELDRLENEKKTFEKNLAIANEFKERYSSDYGKFLSDKKEYPFKEQEYVKKEQRIREVRYSIQNLSKEYDPQIKDLLSRKDIIDNEKKDLQESISKIESYRQMNILMLSEEKEETIISLKELITRWNMLRKKKVGFFEDLQEHITNSDNGLASVLKSFKSFNLPDIGNMNDEDMLFRFAANVKNQISMHDTYLRKTNENFRNTQLNIKTTCDKFNDALQDYKKEVNRINKRLEECVRNISAIDSLEINIEKSMVSGIIKRMFDFSDYIQENRIFVSGERTFETPENYSRSDYLKFFQALVTEAANKKYDDIENITLSDTVKVTFRISENGNDSQWVPYINKEGSEGTGIMTKILLDISMIDIVRQKSKIPAVFNLMVDEVSKLSPDNFNEIIRYANSCGFNIICASPVIGDLSEFGYIYQVYKGDAESGTKPTMTYNVSKLYTEDNENGKIRQE